MLAPFISRVVIVAIAAVVGLVALILNLPASTVPTPTSPPGVPVTLPAPTLSPSPTTPLASPTPPAPSTDNPSPVLSPKIPGGGPSDFPCHAFRPYNLPESPTGLWCRVSEAFRPDATIVRRYCTNRSSSPPCWTCTIPVSGAPNATVECLPETEQNGR